MKGNFVYSFSVLFCKNIDLRPLLLPAATFLSTPTPSWCCLVAFRLRPPPTSRMQRLSCRHIIICRRALSSSSSKSKSPSSSTMTGSLDSTSSSSVSKSSIWENSSFHEPNDYKKTSQPFSGSGVLRSDKMEDIRLMQLNYTAPALAAAVRDREDVLQLAAHLLNEGRLDQLKDVLSPHEQRFVQLRRTKVVDMDLSNGFRTGHITMIRKYLVRMPRQVTIPHRKRASIILPLCNVGGVPSILFEVSE